MSADVSAEITANLSAENEDSAAMPERPGIEAPVEITDQALVEIKKILTTKDIPEGYGLRVGVKGGGCSGMSYVLGFDKKREFDQEFEISEVTVYMDKRQGLYLLNTRIDYHDGLDARGFIFENPNATSTCGCGSSFGV